MGELLHTFTVDGKPVGYYAIGKHPNRDQMKAYHAYNKMVCVYARAAGITLPLIATKDAPLHIATEAWFYNGVHPDPENMHKGIKDALFWAPKGTPRNGGDKYTGGAYLPPRYDKDNPRVKVWIYVADCNTHKGLDRGQG